MSQVQTHGLTIQEYTTYSFAVYISERAVSLCEKNFKSLQEFGREVPKARCLAEVKAYLLRDYRQLSLCLLKQHDITVIKLLKAF